MRASSVASTSAIVHGSAAVVMGWAWVATLLSSPREARSKCVARCSGDDFGGFGFDEMGFFASAPPSSACEGDGYARHSGSSWLHTGGTLLARPRPGWGSEGQRRGCEGASKAREGAAKGQRRGSEGAAMAGGLSP